MSTIDFSSVDANSKTLAISNPNQDDARYRNLNLNSIHQHSETNHALSKNVSFNKGNTFTNFTDHLTSQSKTKNDVNLWHKRDESFKTSEFLTFHDCDEKTNQKRWQKSDGSSANSSTLSLHIAAYESAIDTAETESSKKVQKHFYGSFEIPRQQEDSPVEPEVMQYKSSQKVLNPNETSSAKSLNKKSGKPSDKDKKHHEPQPNALMMYPMKELVFKGPFTDVVTSPLSISNPTEKTIAFKMMVTAPKHYCCRPNIGYVRPGDTVELQVMVEPMKDEKKIEQERHKFMIQSMFVNNAPGDLKSQASQVDEEVQNKELAPPSEFWAKEHNKKDIMFHKFTVAFHQQMMTKDKLDGILMDLTSRAAAEAAAEMERERRREEAERRERERLLKKGKLTPEERARLEVLLALQALALAKQKLTGILRIVPAEEVVFPGPFSEYACSTIRLTNPSDKHIYYKVLVTNPKHYIIKPSFGILKPGETAISVVIIEQQDVYANMEKEYSQLVENLILRDKFMVHAAYASDAATPIPDFWKKREQGSVYAHKLRISLHLLNAEETKKERERREKLKAAGYKNKELVLSGIYGRDSGLNNYYGKDAFGGPVLPYPGDGPNPYGIGAGPAGAGAATTPVGASGAGGVGGAGGASGVGGVGGAGGFDGNRDVNNKQPGGGPEQRPISGYGGGPLGGPGGSVRAMDAPAGGGGNSPGGANNLNNNSPGYNPNAMLGPGGARGGSVMLGPGGGPDGTKSGYAVPGNAYMYAGGGGGATSGGSAGNNYGGSGPANNAAGGGNYGGAGGANNAGSGGNNAGGGNNYGGSAAGNNNAGGPAGSANNRPGSAYGGGPLGGPGGSVRAMDYGGGAGGGSSGPGGAGGGAGNNVAGSANNRGGSAYGGGPLGGPGGSVRAMDGKPGGGNQGYSPGGSSGGGNAASGANNAGGPAGSANNRGGSAYGGGPLGGPGGSVRAMDYGGGAGGGGGGSGNTGGPGYNSGGANAGGSGASGGYAAGGGGPGGAPGGSVMLGAGGGGTNSGYAAPGGGYMYGGGAGAGGSGGGGGQSGGGQSGGGQSGGNSNNPQQDGPQLLLSPGEKLKNVSMYMKN